VVKGTSRDSHSSWERQERPSRKVGKVRVEETQRVHWLSGDGNGDMWTIEDGREEVEKLNSPHFKLKRGWHR
jgi:hypothetical protein